MSTNHYKFIYQEIRKRLPQFLISLLFLAASSGLFLLLPGWSSDLVDLVFNEPKGSELAKSLLFGLGIFTLATVINFTRIYIMNVLTLQVTKDLRERVFDAMLSAQARKIDSAQGSRLISGFSNDIQIFAATFAATISVVVPSLITATLFAGAMLYYNWILFFCLILLMSPLVAFTNYFARKLKLITNDAQINLAELLSQFSVVTGSAREIRLLNFEEKLATKFDVENERNYSLYRGLFLMTALHPMFLALSLAFAITSLVFISLLLINYGLTDAENLMAFLFALGLTYPPLQEAGQQIGAISQLMTSLDRLNVILDIETEKDDGHSKLPPQILGKIEFRNVCFKEPGGKFAIQDFNLTIEAGETVAIIGKSGAGKTTLFELLGRFIDPQAGSILLDGKDIQEFSLSEYRSHVGMVLQQPAIFEETLLFNLRAGRDDVEIDTITEAADRAHVSEFVEKLPDAYETKIEKSGSNLSVGQMQRIAIARLFVKNPEILMLDEPTSALDNESEKHIKNSLDQVSQSKTTLIIAHRPSTVTSADKILVLEKGQIVEFGEHEELFGKKGYYWNFVQSGEMVSVSGVSAYGSK